MTTIHTRPAPRTSAREAQHEHSWATESRHPTSAGYVLYVRCTTCGTHRVDLQDHRETPPAPLSRVVGSPKRAHLWEVLSGTA
ncbi:hypothetical protein [Promicromonospora sp. AC04]|uniref:hypothetical protein n=1 Tax=Promicromonospora sp. AC04 TaxID=2135723 RepID=UPI000D36B529|nr:hypothetical protein [Promicromonospora sp. AC04]